MVVQDKPPSCIKPGEINGRGASARCSVLSLSLVLTGSQILAFFCMQIPAACVFCQCSRCSPPQYLLDLQVSPDVCRCSVRPENSANFVPCADADVPTFWLMMQDANGHWDIAEDALEELQSVEQALCTFHARRYRPGGWIEFDFFVEQTLWEQTAIILTFGGAYLKFLFK